MTITSILALAAAGALIPAPSAATRAAPRAAPRAVTPATIRAAPDAQPLASRTAAHQRVIPGRGRAAASSRPAGLAGVAAVNREAVREPDPRYYLGAAQVYPWEEGSLYRLYAAPEQISDIALQPGETLVSVAAGDTARWVIGDTASGSGPARRSHVLVKPAASGLRTNMVIATDRRIYHVEAVSTDRVAMAAVSWTYPEDDMIVAGTGAGSAPAVSPAVAVEALNFGYRIAGAKVSWRPVRAFDDGHQTFIEFPLDLGDGEAPPLFVIGADGKAEVLNYRVRGHYYVVDRLFSTAELRLGGKHQKIVRIVRDDGSHGSGRGA